MTGAVERMVWFRVEFAFPVRANDGKDEQVGTPPNDEKALVAESAIDSVSGVVTDRASVDHPFFARRGGLATVRHRLATRGCHRSRQHQKFSAVDIHDKVLGKVAQYSNTRLAMTPQCRSWRPPSSRGKIKPNPNRGWTQPMVLRSTRNPAFP